MLPGIESSKKVVGIKQSRKAVRDDKAACVFLASDAEKRITDPMKELCDSKNVEVIYVDTMQELGKACGIDVGAAIAVVLK